MVCAIRNLIKMGVIGVSSKLLDLFIIIVLQKWFSILLSQFSLRYVVKQTVDTKIVNKASKCGGLC